MTRREQPIEPTERLEESLKRQKFECANGEGTAEILISSKMPGSRSVNF